MYTLELTKNILQSNSLLFLFDKVENNLDNGLKKKEEEKKCQEWDSNPRLQE